MALINNLWVHVKSESWDNQVESTSHPVEDGLPITDTVRKQPRELSISGLIVDAGGKTATTIVNTLKDLMNSGSLITYDGVKSASNMQIQSFGYSHSNDVWGGCNFDMELKEVRIAKKAYVPTATNTTAKTSPAVTVKVGSIVVFKGGSVYVSSDAAKAAANRGRSTCKCTIINTRSWAKHPYHLISTDGKKVYGWVDKSSIEGASGAQTAKTNTVAKSGTQQTKQASNDGSPVYHTVKAGDSLYKLVNNTYKSLGTTVQWVIDNNPTVVQYKKVRGEAEKVLTLKVGGKLLMGYRGAYSGKNKQLAKTDTVRK